MRTNWQKTTHREWTRELATSGMDTFGVLKFRNGRHVAPKTALALYKAYWHKVDRTLFGHAADKGYGVRRWCFTELGSDGTNLHLHFECEAVFAVEPFCAVLNALWTSFHLSTAPLKHNWITPIQDQARAAAYTCKSTRTCATDPIGEAVSFQPDTHLDPQDLDREAQIQRISNRLSEHQITKAYQELHRHIHETSERLHRRQKAFIATT